MSMYPSVNPVTAALRDFSPGPHSGVPTDPEAPTAPDTMLGGARTALTLGLMSLLLIVVTGIPAIWVGGRALRTISASDGALRGRWAAWTGIGLGCLSVVGLGAVWLYLHTHG
jgi:hypothetical protein